jgi:hypothetical protein
MSVVHYLAAEQARDVSGNRVHLDNNDASLFGYTNLIPWVEFDGGADFLDSADTGAGGELDFTGTEAYISSSLRGLTIGAWVYFADAASADEVIMAKWDGGGNQRSYRLARDAAGTLSFSVSVDGTAVTTVTSTGTTIPATTWTWVVGRFDPSTELKCFINFDEFTNTTSIPASIFDSSADFTIGRADDPSDWMDGRVSMAFAAACLVSDSIVLQCFEQSRVAYGVLS